MEKGHKLSILANDKKRKNWLHNRDFQVSAFCVAIGAVSWFDILNATYLTGRCWKPLGVPQTFTLYCQIKEVLDSHS